MHSFTHRCKQRRSFVLRILTGTILCFSRKGGISLRDKYQEYILGTVLWRLIAPQTVWRIILCGIVGRAWCHKYTYSICIKGISNYTINFHCHFYYKCVVKECVNVYGSACLLKVWICTSLLSCKLSSCSLKYQCDHHYISEHGGVVDEAVWKRKGWPMNMKKK